MSREVPILFSAPMVRAILDGRKTVTRRVVRLPDWAGRDGAAKLQAQHPPKGIAFFLDGRAVKQYTVPWVEGDVLWVREMFGWAHPTGQPDDLEPRLVFRASEPDVDLWRWRPGIHMPRAIARIFLAVESVTIEPLQAIDEREIVKEGIGDLCNQPSALLDAWIAGWDSLNSKRPGCSWTDNPLVYRIGFRRTEVP